MKFKKILALTITFINISFIINGAAKIESSESTIDLKSMTQEEKNYALLKIVEEVSFDEVSFDEEKTLKSLKKIEDIILAGANINETKNRWGSPIMILSARNIDLITLLLKHGADINVTDDKGHTALRHANEDTFQFLLNNGCVYKIPHDSTLELELLSACTSPERKLSVRHLLKLGADINSMHISSTPLFYAVRQRNLEAVLELIKNKKLDINKTITNNSALSASTAVSIDKIPEENVDIFKLLLNVGADIRIDSQSILYKALTFHSREIIDLLLRGPISLSELPKVIQSINDKYDDFQLAPDVHKLCFEDEPKRRAVKVKERHDCILKEINKYLIPVFHKTVLDYSENSYENLPEVDSRTGLRDRQAEIAKATAGLPDFVHEIIGEFDGTIYKGQ